MGLYKQNVEQNNLTISRLEENIRPAYFQEVTVKEMGDILELKYVSDKMGGIITKLNADEYKNNITRRS